LDYTLGEALKSLEELKAFEIAQPGGGSEENISSERGKARHWLSLTREFMGLVSRLTSDRNVAVEVWLAPILRNRMAVALGYYLDCLVGRKRNSLRVRDPEGLGFKPRELLLTLLEVYYNLATVSVAAAAGGGSDGFASAIIQDERSYHPGNFTEAVKIIAGELGGNSVLSRMGNLNQVLAGVGGLPARCAEAAAAASATPGFSDEEELPEEVLDPVMSDLLTDPVLLPTSRKIMQREHIERVLMDEERDPFNRSFLTAAALIPLPKLKAALEAWVSAARTGGGAKSPPAVSALELVKAEMEAVLGSGAAAPQEEDCVMSSPGGGGGESKQQQAIHSSGVVEGDDEEDRNLREALALSLEAAAASSENFMGNSGDTNIEGGENASEAAIPLDLDEAAELEAALAASLQP